MHQAILIFHIFFRQCLDSLFHDFFLTRFDSCPQTIFDKHTIGKGISVYFNLLVCILVHTIFIALVSDIVQKFIFPLIDDSRKFA